MSSFFLAMMLHPEVQQKAQKEIDRVVGQHRLPTIADRSQLPSVVNIVKEVFRWNPVSPMSKWPISPPLTRRGWSERELTCLLSATYSTTTEDCYEDYVIPAGTTVIANIWQVFSLHITSSQPIIISISKTIRAALHDPELYSNPDQFNPDRYESPSPEPDPVSFAFGFGRR